MPVQPKSPEVKGHGHARGVHCTIKSKLRYAKNAGVVTS